ncbi:hypothetical protein B0H65DRAFT_576778 [Neurospora tetraspora]|uniref:Uncharacterized protein n=1 Tax=Neurospora tetraspora TaxID=94610 RepID=A0AAE0MR33_9PEZI|nr:hypothetical protein B0H65DRAFT_576778 [Neurospora tetraspora]
MGDPVVGLGDDKDSEDDDNNNENNPYALFQAFLNSDTANGIYKGICLLEVSRVTCGQPWLPLAMAPPHRDLPCPTSRPPDLHSLTTHNTSPSLIRSCSILSSSNTTPGPSATTGPAAAPSPSAAFPTPGGRGGSGRGSSTASSSISSSGAASGSSAVSSTTPNAETPSLSAHSDYIRLINKDEDDPIRNIKRIRSIKVP